MTTAPIVFQLTAQEWVDCQCSNGCDDGWDENPECINSYQTITAMNQTGETLVFELNVPYEVFPIFEGEYDLEVLVPADQVRPDGFGSVADNQVREALLWWVGQEVVQQELAGAGFSLAG